MGDRKTRGDVNFIVCFNFDLLSAPHRSAARSGYWSTVSTTSFPASSLSRQREDNSNKFCSFHSCVTSNLWQNLIPKPEKVRDPGN